MVFLAKNKVALADMMDTLKRYLKEKKLELCVKKTKIMIFNSRIERKKETWKWEKRIEEERFLSI